MTADEMKVACVEAMATPGSVGVFLTIPKGKIPNTFPRGDLLSEVERDGVVERTYSFSPAKVLQWLENTK